MPSVRAAVIMDEDWCAIRYQGACMSAGAAAQHASALAGIVPRAQALCALLDDEVLVISVRTKLHVEYLLAPDTHAGSDACVLLVQGPEIESLRVVQPTLAPMLATSTHLWLFGEAEE